MPAAMDPWGLLMAPMRTAPPLRIGIITDGLQERMVDGEVRIANGGVGVYIYQLIRHLLLIDPVNQYFLIRFGRGMLDVYRHWARLSNVLFMRVASKVNRTLGTGSTFLYASLVHKLNLDLVHYPNQFGGAFLPRTVKRVATLHDLTPLLFPHLHPRSRVLGYRMLARYSLRRCDRVIVYSANTRRDLLNRGMATQNAIVNIPLGVNPGLEPGVATDGFVRRYQLTTRPFILSVGVLEPRKNHVLLFEVLRRSARQGASRSRPNRDHRARRMALEKSALDAAAVQERLASRGCGSWPGRARCRSGGILQPRRGLRLPLAGYEALGFGLPIL